MKKLVCAGILAMLISFTAKAQKQIVWFDAGLKVQSGATGFFNQAIADSDQVDYAISTGLGLGGKLGINFGYTGLAIELMYSNTNGEFEHQDFVGVSSLQTKNLDLYLLFRNAKGLGFFEIGPKFSFMRSATFSRTGMTQAIADTDVKDFYKNGITGVVSFGANLIGNDGRFSGQLGLRLEYGITDIVSDSGQAANAPVLLDGLYSEGYKATRPVFAGVVFELNWGIGYYGQTKCGGKKKFFMF